jgi:3-ketosteroid 9alpha-monooxygenase subunit A
MTARFEFEIDTSHAVETWEQEVADNLRRRAEEESPE